MHAALIALVGASLAAAAPPSLPSPFVSQNFTESFEYPGSCYYDSCPDPIPGPVNGISWLNMSILAFESCGGVSPLGPVPDSGSFDAEFAGPDGVGGYGPGATDSGAGPAYMSASYNGSCVEYFNLKQFAWSCAATQTASNEMYTFNYTNVANCSMDVIGETVGGARVVSTVNYLAQPGYPLGCPHWSMGTSVLPRSFSILPLRSVKFVPTVKKGYGYDNQIAQVTLDTVEYTVTNRTGCYKA